MEEELERRDRLLIEALPIGSVVDIVKQPRKPVDPTKKQYFKPVGPYDGTLGIPIQAELDTGPTVTEESEQLVIDETRDELNTAGPVMVDGKLKNQKLFNYFTSCNNYNFSCVCVLRFTVDPSAD